MHVIVVGLNYRTAPVEIREKFAFSEQELPRALQQFFGSNGILECVIVATCNRTELYAVVDGHDLCGHQIREFMEEWFHIPRHQFTNHLYMYEDDRAIQHLFKVTSGLDSMIIGETQILGQIRDAFLLAQQQKTTGTIFNMLFKQAVTLAKRAHSETAIGETAVSVSYAAVELGKRIFGQFHNKVVMILGAGETGELTAKHLYANGAKQVIVVNRTYERAKQLADQFDGQAYTLDDVSDKLHQADIIISSTGADQYVVTASQVDRAMVKRKSKPLFMIDIAVPRDIDPTIAKLDNVFLYDIDDLEGIVETNLQHRRQEAVKIEAMISEEMSTFYEWYRTLGVTPVIRALQQKANTIHSRTMTSLSNKLPELDEHEWKVIEKLTKSMLNQMLQDPIIQMKEITGKKRSEEAIDTFVQLFALEEQIHEQQKDEQLSQSKQSARKTMKAKLTSNAPLAALSQL